MAIDVSIPRTRRALLAGGIGGLAALVASALGRPLPTRAWNGDPLVLGDSNYATALTTIKQTSYGVDAFWAEADHGTALAAFSDSGTAVQALTNTGTAVQAFGQGAAWPAVLGQSIGDGTGILGCSRGGVAPPAVAKTGVFGYAIQDSGSRGVLGHTYAGQGVRGIATTGQGVHGEAPNGIGVYAASREGYALRAVGRVKLDKCAGVATIAATKSSVVVTPGIDLTASSAVVATLQGSAGGTTTVHRCVVNTTTNTFTIYLTKAATQNVKVAWHVFG